MNHHRPCRKTRKTGRTLNVAPCGLCQLLERFDAVYSVKARQLEFVAGTISPVQCTACDGWFLVEESEGGGRN